MGRRSRNLICGLVTVALAATVPVARPAEAGGPLRSGTIVGGYVIMTGPPPCQVTPDCAAWVVSNCNARLAGRDPGLFSSIVDVRAYARTDRTLKLSSAWLAGVVEFWNRDCRRLRFFVPDYTHLRFTVPADTHWMTITAGTPALYWELW